MGGALRCFAVDSDPAEGPLRPLRCCARTRSWGRWLACFASGALVSRAKPRTSSLIGGELLLNGMFGLFKKIVDGLVVLRLIHAGGS